MLHIMGLFLCWWVTVAQQAALKSSFKLCLKVHLSFGFLVFFFPSKIHFVGFKKRKKFKQGTHLRVAALLMEKALENSDKWDMTKKNLSFWTLVLLTEHFLLFLSCFFFWTEGKIKIRGRAQHFSRFSELFVGIIYKLSPVTQSIPHRKSSWVRAPNVFYTWDTEADLI